MSLTSHWYYNVMPARRAWVHHCCKTGNQLLMQAGCSPLQKLTMLKLKRSFWPSCFEMIFGKPLASAPRRLQKMFMCLQCYDINIQYKKGSEMYLADTLSRHFSGDEAHLTRSEIEEEIKGMPCIEEINQMIAA